MFLGVVPPPNRRKFVNNKVTTLQRRLFQAYEHYERYDELSIVVFTDKILLSDFKRRGFDRLALSSVLGYGFVKDGTRYLI